VTKNTVNEYQLDYKAAIIEAKQSAWEKFTSEIEDAKETSKLLKALGKNHQMKLVSYKRMMETTVPLHQKACNYS